VQASAYRHCTRLSFAAQGAAYLTLQRPLHTVATVLAPLLEATN